MRNKTLLIVFLAVLAGLVNILPQVLIWNSLKNSGQPYQAVNYLATNDELKIYVPRAREIYDGHFPPNDIFADKQGPTPFNVLPSALMAVFIYLAGGNMNWAYLSAQFFFSALIFLVFYLAIFYLTKNRGWAILGSLVAVWTPLGTHFSRAFTGAKEFLNLAVKNFYPLTRTPIDHSFISRIDDPLLTWGIYLFAFWAIARFWFQPGRKTGIIAGLAAGLLFYTYLHYWIYLAIVLGLLFLYRLLKREDWKSFIWLVAALVVVSVPYFINYFSFISSPAAGDFMARGAFIEPGRYFRLAGVIGEYALYAVLGMAVWLAFWKTERRKAVFFLAIIAATFIAWNIQAVVGYTFISSHWRQAFNPLGLILILALAQKLSAKLPARTVGRVLMILIFLLAVKKGANAYAFFNPPADVKERHSIPESIVQSFDWINKNLDGEPKIISPSFMTAFNLAVYTPARPYLYYAPHSLASNEEIENHFLAAQKLFGIEKDVMKKRLRFNFRDYGYDCEKILAVFQGVSEKCTLYTLYNVAETGAHLYLGYFQKGEFNNETVSKIWSQPFITEEKAEELAERFERLEIDWAQIPADYVYYGPWEKELTAKDFSRDENLTPIYQNPEVILYKIKQ
jgi:hypothetical protein